MSTTNETATHLDWLRDQLAGYEERLSQAEATVTRLRPTVASLRFALEALQTDGGSPPPPTPDMFGNKVESAMSDRYPVLTRLFTQGNQNPDMPARRPEFVDKTLIQAGGVVVNAAHGAVHGDDVTKAVFDIKTPSDFALAKRSMTSELFRGAKKGLWVALGGNRYRRN